MNQKMQLDYKDANRNYWRIVADERLQSEEDETGYFETEWRVSIGFSDSGADFIPVFETIITTQYDEPIRKDDILKEWLFNTSCVAIGIAQFGGNGKWTEC